MSATAFVALTRPLFLLGGALVYLLGAVAAVGWGGIDWSRFFLGQAMVTSVQLATQYWNEVHDVAADAANPHRTWLSGGSGVIAAGRLDVAVARRAAGITSVVAMAVAVAVAVAEPVACLIGVMALGAGWAYSAPPLRLVGSGWGEVLASVEVAVAVPVTGALLQDRIPGDLVLMAAPLALLHLAMLLALATPDRDGDAATGKQTLVVRLSAPSAATLHRVVLASAGVVLAAITLGGVVSPLAAAAAAGAAVVPAAVQWRLIDGPPARYPVLTTAAVATFAVAAAGLVFA